MPTSGQGACGARCHVCAGQPTCRLCAQTVVGDQVTQWQLLWDSNCLCGEPPLDGAPCAAHTTFAIRTREEADALCAVERDCFVCVEREDSAGPNLWSVTRNAPGCACPVRP